MNNNDYTSKINNIMDKAKEDVRTQIDRAYQQGYDDAKSELGQNAIDLAHAESDRAYQQGLEDAWEAAKKIALDDGLSSQELMQIFGTPYSDKVVKENTVSEAISKIKEYEDKQKQDTEIKVGDEVIDKKDNTKAVVLDIDIDGVYWIYDENGCASTINPCEVTKSGRTFSQIAEVLAEMRGDKE